MFKKNFANPSRLIKGWRKKERLLQKHKRNKTLLVLQLLLLTPNTGITDGFTVIKRLGQQTCTE